MQIQTYTFKYKSNTSLYIQLQVKYKLIHSNTSQIQAYTFKYKLKHSNASQIQAYTFKYKSNTGLYIQAETDKSRTCHCKLKITFVITLKTIYD